MNSEQKTNFALFASAKLNDKKVFEQYKDSIDNIIKNSTMGWSCLQCKIFIIL